MPKNLEATIDIAAAPEQVWNVVSDLKRMPEFSPQCIRMQPLGSVRTGTWTINLNKDGAKVWPTTSRVVRFEPNRAIAFRMTENRTIWSFTLEPTANGTKVTQRRDVVGNVPWVIRKMIDTTLGGEVNFEDGLVQGMNETLGKIKTAVER
ncbi:SRPBCC family protein [Nocardia sp. 2]|uniref:SRPBCC family protein n=1 Tax=Nocardia acididurans TaxID=2802282 RepID=A0ABS1M0W8_9NOCA|nr:SRPBCC family protein [Nocardia acididurans]MBL1072788.1 SRPBCC family protein [Nocardia acididurans]